MKASQSIKEYCNEYRFKRKSRCGKWRRTLIGKAVVQALVSAGAHVAILDIDAKARQLQKALTMT